MKTRLFVTGIVIAKTFLIIGIALAAEVPAGNSGKELQAEFRTWTDSTGTHKVEAAFVDIKDGQVRLKKKDGNILTIALDKLSDGDREVVAKTRVSSKTPDGKEAAGVSEKPEGVKGKHCRCVLALKFGQKKYAPGNTFEIMPKEDSPITGDSNIKFTCRRIMGDKAIQYRIQIGIIVGTGINEVMVMTCPYIQVDGNFTSELTWPASKKDIEIEFPVAFDNGGTRLTGKGSVYFFLDNGKGVVLSNIISIDADVGKSK